MTINVTRLTRLKSLTFPADSTRLDSFESESSQIWLMTQESSTTLLASTDLNLCLSAEGCYGRYLQRPPSAGGEKEGAHRCSQGHVSCAVQWDRGKKTNAILTTISVLVGISAFTVVFSFLVVLHSFLVPLYVHCLDCSIRHTFL